MIISETISKYINLRKQLDNKRKEYKDFELKVKQELIDLELLILGESQRTGVTSFKTDYGTAYRVVKKFATVEDRDKLIEFSLDNKDFGLFTNHVNKAHVLELIEEGLDPGIFGINYTEEQAINVRKS